VTATVALYALAGVLLAVLGLASLLVQPAIVRKLIALNVMASGVFLLWVALARRGAGEPEPVSHAMVLTGIVVAVSVSAVALALLRQLAADLARRGEPFDDDV